MEVTFTDIAETSLILNQVKFFNTVSTYYFTTFNNDGYFYFYSWI